MTDPLSPEVVAALPKRVRDQRVRMIAAFDAVDALLRRLGVQGLQRLSRSSTHELQAMAQTAHNAKLVRIEREIERLATLAQGYLDRDPLFTTVAWRTTINRIWLLVRVARRRHEDGQLPSEMLDVLGIARRTYVILDESLDLQCLGCSAWRTDTGFIGITAWLDCEDRPELLQVTVARPTMHFGEEPQRLWRYDLNDAVTLTMETLGQGAWQFTHGKCSSDNRLSIHAELEVSEAPYRGQRAYSRWQVNSGSALIERLRAARLDPFAGDAVVPVFFQDMRWSELTIDETRQQARATVTLPKGGMVPIVVPLRVENNLLVDNLERLFGGESPPADGLFGQVYLADDGVVFMPFTAVYDQQIKLKGQGTQQHAVHLGLESLENVKRC